jgi:lysophospholipase L1-like esterase
MRWLVNLAVMGVAALIPCLIAEAGLRIVAPPADSEHMWRRLPSAAEWSGQPGTQGLHTGVPVSFNALGFRDAERSPQPAPGALRVLALGDSVTFGMGVRQELTWPRQAEQLLSSGRPAPVEVLNMGMPGYNTIHQLAQLKEVGLGLQPKVVVVGFLYNDIELSSAQIGEGSVPKQEVSSGRQIKSQLNAAALWLKKNSLFVAWLSPRIGNALRLLGVKGLGQVGEIKDQYTDANPNWRRMQAALLEMKQLTSERGIDLVVMVIPAFTRFNDAAYPIKEYHQAVAGFCRENGIKVLDLLPKFWGQDGTQYWISATDGHPNAEGQRRMAVALAEYLGPMLPQANLQFTGMTK